MVSQFKREKNNNKKGYSFNNRILIQSQLTKLTYSQYIYCSSYSSYIIQMNSKQQGFQENENDFYEYVNHRNFQVAASFRKTIQKSKNKMIFKNPLSLYHNLQITQSPDQKLYQTAYTQNKYLEKQEILETSDLQQQRQIEMQPLQSIVFKKDKPQTNLTDNNEPRQILQKVSDIFPKKYVCCYNKFQQNIFLKHDLTIIVKNIFKILKLELLKPIQTKSEQNKRYLTQNSDINFKSPQKQRRQYTSNRTNQKQKTSQRNKKSYQSQESLNSQDNKIYVKRAQKSPLQLQKALILSTTRNKQKNSQIQFFSNFESGNLHLAFRDKIDSNLFYLFLTNDTNTHGYNQWFYFGIKINSAEIKKYRFIIMNISKQFRYHPSMKILQLKNDKWIRKQQFMLYKNKYTKYNGGNLTSLDFQYQNEGKRDQVTYFALSYPYTYSRILNLFKQIKLKTFKNLFVSIESLGKTQLTNEIPFIKIQKSKKKQEKSNSKKSHILFLARQHAGQTPSSFICQSIIKMLIYEKQYQKLLQKFNFVIIPMCNPDGVIHGNSRTNIKGYDINRLWQLSKPCIQSMQTEVINNYITNLSKQSAIQYVFDLHSHSKQYGSFLYCCQENSNKKLLNYYFTLNYPECSYDKCKVNLTSDKKFTFRGQMYYRLGIRNAYTIQTSYYGYRQNSGNDQENRIIPFTLTNFQNIAKSILFSLSQIMNLQASKNKSEKVRQLQKTIRQLDQKFRLKERLNQLKQNKQDNSDSDSDPQNQYLQIKQRQQNGQDFQSNLNKSMIQDQIQRKRTTSIQQNSLFQRRRSKNLMAQNRSLKLIPKIQCQYQKSSQKKPARKRVFSSKQNKLKSQVYLKSSFNDGYQNSMPKKYPSQVERQLNLRNTVRRGFQMSKSSTNFYQFSHQFKKKDQTRIQQKSFVVYPTSSNIAINYENIRLLHQTLFQGTIKVKNIKQQSRILRKSQKSDRKQRVTSLYLNLTQKKIGQPSQRKTILKNKMIQSSIETPKLNQYLNIQKIEPLQDRTYK